jgi:hypothetical protein
MRISLRTERSERKWNQAVSMDQQSIPLGQPIQNGAQHHRRSFVPAHCMLCMRSAQRTRTNLRAFLLVADLSSRSLPRGLLGGNTCLRQPNAPRQARGYRVACTRLLGKFSSWTYQDRITSRSRWSRSGVSRLCVRQSIPLSPPSFHPPQLQGATTPEAQRSVSLVPIERFP